jgi:hypothetical protein
MAKRGPTHCRKCQAPLPEFEQSRGVGTCQGCDMESVSSQNIDELYVVVQENRPCGSRILGNLVWDSKIAADKYRENQIKQRKLVVNKRITVKHLEEELEYFCGPEDMKGRQ